ncbi:ferritin-like domain-containing protein [Candidatus Berkiella aquae]|uniref:DNA starvation/stationary phase protection protein n=1 Tax=Candidatus Berkiella aquae TaxID=295108 RepID=A0A0Q9Z095_9GAMM|nr:DNA starvation/stationary phase protection protein [Candidatus Berkiella aquae]MCS5712343.1 DNA starvation/stationary phase protection protein [Candidatus Berkiella aquae]
MGGATSGLKVFLANTYTLYLKTQNYHWNVIGPHFHSLHNLFEEQYKELANAVDEIAERIRALGDVTPGSLEEFSKLKTISEAKTRIDDISMIKDLIESHEIICKHVNLILRQAQDEQDDVTQDLLIGRLRVHEKTLWMLRAYVV